MAAQRTLADDIAPQTEPNQRQMADKLNQTSPVRTFRQRTLLVGRQATQHIAMSLGFRHHTKPPTGW